MQIPSMVKTLVSSLLDSLHVCTEKYACSLGSSAFHCEYAGGMPKPLKLAEHKIKWHGTLVHRLRLSSYAAEKFWHMAFGLQLGMNRLSPDAVRTAWLDDGEVDGIKKRGEVEVELPADYQELAFKIACAAVELLESHGYRILNAIVPERDANDSDDVQNSSKKKEHDLVAERKGLWGPSSWEIKCKTIQYPDKLLATVQKQLRKDALKLWRPKAYSERGVLLFEFADGAKDHTWRTSRCEAFNGTWGEIFGWGQTQVAPALASKVGLKRKVDTDYPSSAVSDKRKKATRGSGSSTGGSSNRENFVLIGGVPFTTLAWYLGRQAVKSEQQMAAAACSNGQVDLRFGDSKSLQALRGQELLSESQFGAFHQHRWVEINAPNPKPERARLQVRLLSDGQTPGARFLWDLSGLQRCVALKVC